MQDELLLEINEDVSLALEPAKLFVNGPKGEIGLGVSLREGDDTIEFYLEAEQVSKLRAFLDAHFQPTQN